MKVFVTVGTGGFDALVREADRLDCEVVCQIGRGAYAPKKQQWFRVCPSLEPWYEWADVIVAHGGAGTLLEALARSKKVIAVPHPGRTDRHQEELVEELARGNVLVRCATVADLPAALRAINQQKLAAYVPPPCAIPELIHAFVRRTRA
jgi:beta-1,4-N-acetylglucosaminyltransferase